MLLHILLLLVGYAADAAVQAAVTGRQWSVPINCRVSMLYMMTLYSV